MEQESTKFSMEVIDTQGFNDDTNIGEWVDEITDFIEERYEDVLKEEQRIKRNPQFEDRRIHVLLYFISPNGDGMSDDDIFFITKIGPLVNLIPVIAKTDSFTIEELEQLKENVQKDILAENLPVFNFSVDPEEDENIVLKSEELRRKMPFSVIGATAKRDGRRGRDYVWGFADCDDPEHSDTNLLCETILSTKRQDLKDITEIYLYEQYRTENLTKAGL